MKFHFIYLAAGYSRRFGGNKLLAPYGGVPLYRILLERLADIVRTDERVIDLTVVTQYPEIVEQVDAIEENVKDHEEITEAAKSMAEKPKDHAEITEAAKSMAEKPKDHAEITKALKSMAENPKDHAEITEDVKPMVENPKAHAEPTEHVKDMVNYPKAQAETEDQIKATEAASAGTQSPGFTDQRTGHRERPAIRCTVNPDPSRGISSSLQCGIEALLGDCRLTREDVLVFFVADAPRLRAETVRKFLASFEKSGKRLGCIGVGGEMGNPCAFANEFLPELMTLTGDCGGKCILKSHRGEVFIFSDAEPDELEDMDYTW